VALRVALVHDWLLTWRGGEKVLEVLAERFPQAELFTLFHAPGAMSPALEARRIHTSLLDAVPFARSHHRHFLPLMPLAVRALDLSGFELVISSSHAVAKGVRVPKGARHLAYLHAPLRYMWDRFDDYFGPGRAALPVRAAARALRPALRAWDVASARGVDRFVANSQNVARQIAARYGREAAVVYPPVELERFTAQPLEGSGRGGYFLWVGALAPYKRVDLALEAFARLGLPLKLVGSGQEGRALRRLPPNVEVLGQVGDAQLPGLYRDARALIFPGVEDFGLTPLEAQASGRPVIAFAAGGALETLTPQTGLFFAAPTAEALAQAVKDFDRFEETFSPQVARAQALRFSKEAFLEGIEAQLQALGGGPW
jgi:glycosyltransferase involved in cell wall biosynthesis